MAGTFAAGYKKLQQERDTIIGYLADQKIAARLADKLLGAEFITQSVYDQAKNFAPGMVERDRVTVMFDAVLASMRVNPPKYNKFLTILKEIKGLGDIVVFIDGGAGGGGGSGDSRDDSSDGAAGGGSSSDAAAGRTRGDGPAGSGGDSDDGFGSYRLNGVRITKEVFGRGSSAMVLGLEYRGLKCAGKKLHPFLCEPGVGETVRRFKEECRLLAEMRHPNIVEFIGVYFEEGSRVPILVMEFLPTTLARCIDTDGVLPEEISYSILHDVALGLYHLHSHTPPIVHRDLSANNVLLTPNMTAKISDLGVARILNLNPQEMSRMTRAPGTPAYMPPEAMRANPRYDTRIDEFSYGILMIHVLCGKWPLPLCEAVRVNPANPTQLLPVSEAGRRDEYLQTIGKAHPLMDLILRCVSNDPEQRTRAAEIVQHIEHMKRQSPPTFANRVEMLQQIRADETTKQNLRAELKAEKKRLQAEIVSKDRKIESKYHGTRHRSVLIVGKSGAGKSTIANHLVKHDPLSSYPPPFSVSSKVLQSVTREARHEIVEFMQENIVYRVTVIDTIGLFDTSIRDQQSIFDKIGTYCKDYINGINLILFVMKKGRFTAEELQVFSFIRSRFDKEISRISALAITFCENDTPQNRADLIQEFFSAKNTKQIASQIEMGIHPVGFPPLKTMIPQIRPFYKQQMEEDRDTLLDLIVRANNPLSTKQLFVTKTETCTIQ